MYSAAKNIDKYRIIPYVELTGVAIHDNNEPLVPIPNDILHRNAAYPYLRSQTLHRLQKAKQELYSINPNLDIEVFSAYRPFELQSKMFQDVRNKVLSKNPLLGGEDLLEEVHKFVAVPDVAPHPTGGAVDLTLICRHSKKKLPMGTDYAEFESDKLPFLSPGLSVEERENRRILRNIMIEAGFAPYNGEWWHFSFGDREWAAYYGFANAIYDAIQVSTKNQKEGYFMSNRDKGHIGIASK